MATTAFPQRQGWEKMRVVVKLGHSEPGRQGLMNYLRFIDARFSRSSYLLFSFVEVQIRGDFHGLPWLLSLLLVYFLLDVRMM